MTPHRFGPLAILALGLMAAPAYAETLTGALVATYNNNPTLNAARAGQRATDEGVPQALALFRPTITGTASYGYTSTTSLSAPTSSNPNPSPSALNSAPGQFSVTISQPIFRGFRSVNTLKRSESSVLLGRETLRNTEQNVLLQAVEAYMNVIRDQAIVGFTQQNLEFLDAQVKASNDRLNVGEGTRTDVAQADAAKAVALTNLAVARANLATSLATFEQVTGNKPRNLMSSPPIDGLIPSNVEAAIAKALALHPAILAARYNVDVAAFNVKTIEGELLPSVSINGSATRNQTSTDNYATWSNSAQITGSISVPIYDGGAIASRVRQAKEQLDQLRISVNTSIDAIKALIATDVALVISARAQVRSAQASISASQLALDGVTEERKVGQRTTLDVLNAQATLLTARITYAQAARNRVVSTYTLLSAIGGLNPVTLRLPVKLYQPEEHYVAVRNKLHGVRTPDGR